MEKILALIAVSFGKKATVYAIGRVSETDKPHPRKPSLLYGYMREQANPVCPLFCTM